MLGSRALKRDTCSLIQKVVIYSDISFVPHHIAELQAAGMDSDISFVPHHIAELQAAGVDIVLKTLWK